MSSLPRRVLRRGRAAAALARQGPRPIVAGRLARAGLVDRDWYARQSGRQWRSERAAALDYLRSGRRAGWSLHPLLEPEWIVGVTWRTSQLDPVQLYLAGRTERGGPGPAFDDATYLVAAPEAITDPGGPLGHFLRRQPGALLPVPHGREPVTAAGVRTRMDTGSPAARAAVDWADERARLPRLSAGLTSLVLAVTDEWPEALALVDGALRPGSVGPVEVIIVASRTRPAVRRILRATYGDDPRVRWLQCGEALSTAQAWNAGLAAAIGDVAVLARARCTIRASGADPEQPWWGPLRTALDDPSVAAVAPLVLGPTGTVAGAGLGVHGPAATPYLLFVDEAADELVAGGDVAPAALGDEVLAARVADLVAAGGVDPAYEGALWGADLSRRLAEVARGVGSAGDLLVLPTVRLVAPADQNPTRAVAADVTRLERRWAAGFAHPGWDETATWGRVDVAVTGLAPAPQAPLPVPVLVRARTEPAGSQPILRWAIKIAAPSSEQGDRWGDVHFAGDLAAALRRLDQHVGVDRTPAHDRATARLDDVVLNLRGLATPHLRPDQVNVIWVISHPDQVDASELRAYDLRFAASTTWSAAMTASSGVAIQPLLQATDPARFHPGLAEPDSGPAVLFVGNSRGVVRPIVRDALAAGADLNVYGTQWQDFIDPRFVRGGYLPNQTVGAAYRAAGVVLNDHWPDMAAQGFVSNRVFDVVASGGRVVSDPVEGLAALFEGAVLEYRTPADIARWTGPDRAEVFPGSAALLEISARVRAEHSFDARALQLLQAVVVVLDQRRAPGSA